MDIRFITPFINAVINTIQTMLGETPERLPPFTKSTGMPQGDISGVIHFSIPA